jgi:magnesium-transporting ATPase (P-type)
LFLIVLHTSSCHINQQHNSPALRRADMGIAMTITGSEVSREAASLVLLDDRFASVVEGIKRGRIIFASMKKVRMQYYYATHC